PPTANLLSSAAKAQGGPPYRSARRQMSSTSPATDTAALQVARFRQFLVWMFRVPVAFAVVEAVLFLRYRYPMLGRTLLITTAFALVLAVARLLLAAGHLLPAVAATCAALFALAFG